MSILFKNSIVSHIKSVSFNFKNAFSTATLLRLKESKSYSTVNSQVNYTNAHFIEFLPVSAKQEQNSLIVPSDYVPSAREPNLIKAVQTEGTKFCPKCTLGLDIKHTDVLILSQYLRSDGCMLPKRITGLCSVQQKRIGKLVTMAQKAGKFFNWVLILKVLVTFFFF